MADFILLEKVLVVGRDKTRGANSFLYALICISDIVTKNN